MVDVLNITTIGNVAIGAIRITSIPHLSILSHKENWQEDNEYITSVYKEDMRSMLYEVYQHFKMRFLEKGEEQMDSIELLWITSSVNNQPYKADISLYIIVRSIHKDKDEAHKTVESLMNICSSTLEIDKYGIEFCTANEVCQALAKVDLSHAKALVKSERIDAVNTTALQACFSYDVLAPTNVDMSRLVNTLIQNPGCALSMQLIPSYFNKEELQELNNKSQMLGMLVNGVSVQGVGNVQIESAKRAADTYNYYKLQCDQPVFAYNIFIYASQQSSAEIAAKLMGQLNVGQPRAAALNTIKISGFNPIKDYLIIPWVARKWLDAYGHNPEVWNSGYATNSHRRLPFLILGNEACEFFRLPIGNENIGAGLNVNETGSRSKKYAKGILNDCELPFGRLKSSPKGDNIGLRLMDLAKHMLIVGTPGSGKTNFSIGLLRTLWLKYKIPFLVIEPAKNEYRALIQNIPDLQVFTPGKNTISPFVFNPFVPPENVRLEAYKSTLKTAFAAGVTMASPLDKIFEDTIENCYSKFRWLNSYTKNDKGKTFNIADFIKCFRETFDEIGYTGQSLNIGKAGLVRLKGLEKLFDNYYSIPIKDLLTKPTVVELAAIENSDEKSLFIALILLSVLSYVNANYVGEGDKLRNFILVEEAHVLLDASSHGGEGAANPAEIAQGLVKRMLAEIRSYGVSVAIADQSPRKVGIDIVALTDIKLAFRLVESTDREILANSVSMNPQQMSRLAKMKPGEAFLFFNKMNEPEEIVTQENRNSQGYRNTIPDKEIAELTTYWKKRPELLRPYTECCQCKDCQNTCAYNIRLLGKEIAKRIFKNKYKAKGDKDKTTQFTEISGHLTEYIQAELNGETYSETLRGCVRLHLWRLIKYS